MSKSTENYARINLILSKEDKEKWDKIAGDLLDVSLSKLIRDAVNDYIGRIEHYERIIKKDSFGKYTIQKKCERSRIVNSES